MSMDPGEYLETYDDGAGDDGRAPLALAAGLAAALVSGVLWALLVHFTNMEIGYAAWGIGLLVGLAMARLTQVRSQQLAMAAAVLACAGLIAGKVFIFAGGTGKLTQAFEEDVDVLKSAVAWQMYTARELDAATLEEIDATDAAGDTLSDAVWHSMREQAGARIENMTAAEKRDAARLAAESTMAGIGLVGGVRSQLSGFDLLWLFLAVGTAYRIMAPAREVAVADEPVAAGGV